MQKTRCFLKNNTFLLKILFISGCLGAIGTSLYCLFHKYIQYKFETNEDIYYAYQHIDIANWNLGAGLLVWGLGLILFYFYVKLIIKNETTKKLEIKQKSRALTVYLVLTFIVTIILIGLPILLIANTYGLETIILVLLVLWWAWYTILLMFYSVLNWLKKGGNTIEKTAIIAGLIGALIGAFFGK